MIESYHIRKCIEFKHQETTKVIEENKVILEMKPQKSIIIENKKVIPFKCSYRKQINQSIMVDETLYESYVIPTDFKCYYFESEKILFLNLSKSTTNIFIKTLEKKCEYKLKKIEFDLRKILKSSKTQSKGLYFKNTDVYVKSKSFHGVNVEKDREADKALKDGQVTYITVSLDVNNTEKTINISKNSSISVVSKCDNEESYLKLVYNSFNIIKTLI